MNSIHNEQQDRGTPVASITSHSSPLLPPLESNIYMQHYLPSQHIAQPQQQQEVQHATGQKNGWFKKMKSTNTSLPTLHPHASSSIPPSSSNPPPLNPLLPPLDASNAQLSLASRIAIRPSKWKSDKARAEAWKRNVFEPEMPTKPNKSVPVAEYDDEKEPTSSREVVRWIGLQPRHTYAHNIASLASPTTSTSAASSTSPHNPWQHDTGTFSLDFITQSNLLEQKEKEKESMQKQSQPSAYYSLVQNTTERLLLYMQELDGEDVAASKTNKHANSHNRIQYDPYQTTVHNVETLLASLSSTDKHKLFEELAYFFSHHQKVEANNLRQLTAQEYRASEQEEEVEHSKQQIFQHMHEYELQLLRSLNHYYANLQKNTKFAHAMKLKYLRRQQQLSQQQGNPDSSSAHEAILLAEEQLRDILFDEYHTLQFDTMELYSPLNVSIFDDFMAQIGTNPSSTSTRSLHHAQSTALISHSHSPSPSSSGTNTPQMQQRRINVSKSTSALMPNTKHLSIPEALTQGFFSSSNNASLKMKYELLLMILSSKCTEYLSQVRSDHCLVQQQEAFEHTCTPILHSIHSHSLLFQQEKHKQQELQTQLNALQQRLNELEALGSVSAIEQLKRREREEEENKIKSEFAQQTNTIQTEIQSTIDSISKCEHVNMELSKKLERLEGELVHLHKQREADKTHHKVLEAKLKKELQMVLDGEIPNYLQEEIEKELRLQEKMAQTQKYVGNGRLTMEVNVLLASDRTGSNQPAQQIGHLQILSPPRTMPRSAITPSLPDVPSDSEGDGEAESSPTAHLSPHPKSPLSSRHAARSPSSLHALHARLQSGAASPIMTRQQQRLIMMATERRNESERQQSAQRAAAEKQAKIEAQQALQAKHKEEQQQAMRMVKDSMKQLEEHRDFLQRELDQLILAEKAQQEALKPPAAAEEAAPSTESSDQPQQASAVTAAAEKSAEHDSETSESEKEEKEEKDEEEEADTVASPKNNVPPPANPPAPKLRRASTINPVKTAQKPAAAKPPAQAGKKPPLMHTASMAHTKPGLKKASSVVSSSSSSSLKHSNSNDKFLHLPPELEALFKVSTVSPKNQASIEHQLKTYYESQLKEYEKLEKELSKQQQVHVKLESAAQQQSALNELIIAYKQQLDEKGKNYNNLITKALELGVEFDLDRSQSLPSSHDYSHAYADWLIVPDVDAWNMDWQIKQNEESKRGVAAAPMPLSQRAAHYKQYLHVSATSPKPVVAIKSISVNTAITNVKPSVAHSRTASQLAMGSALSSVAVSPIAASLPKSIPATIPARTGSSGPSSPHKELTHDEELDAFEHSVASEAWEDEERLKLTDELTLSYATRVHLYTSKLQKLESQFESRRLAQAPSFELDILQDKISKLQTKLSQLQQQKEDELNALLDQRRLIWESQWLAGAEARKQRRADAEREAEAHNKEIESEQAVDTASATLPTDMQKSEPSKKHKKSLMVKKPTQPVQRQLAKMPSTKKLGIPEESKQTEPIKVSEPVVAITPATIPDPVDQPAAQPVMQVVVTEQEQPTVQQEPVAVPVEQTAVSNATAAVMLHKQLSMPPVSSKLSRGSVQLNKKLAHKKSSSQVSISAATSPSNQAEKKKVAKLAEAQPPAVDTAPAEDAISNPAAPPKQSNIEELQQQLQQLYASAAASKTAFQAFMSEARTWKDDIQQMQEQNEKEEQDRQRQLQLAQEEKQKQYDEELAQLQREQQLQQQIQKEQAEQKEAQLRAAHAPARPPRLKLQAEQYADEMIQAIHSSKEAQLLAAQSNPSAPEPALSIPSAATVPTAVPAVSTHPAFISRSDQHVEQESTAADHQQDVADTGHQLLYNETGRVRSATGTALPGAQLVHSAHTAHEVSQADYSDLQITSDQYQEAMKAHAAFKPRSRSSSVASHRSHASISNASSRVVTPSMSADPLEVAGTSTPINARARSASRSKTDSPAAVHSRTPTHEQGWSDEALSKAHPNVVFDMSTAQEATDSTPIQAVQNDTIVAASTGKSHSSATTRTKRDSSKSPAATVLPVASFGSSSFPSLPPASSAQPKVRMSRKALYQSKLEERRVKDEADIAVEKKVHPQPLIFPPPQHSDPASSAAPSKPVRGNAGKKVVAPKTQVSVSAFDAFSAIPATVEKHKTSSVSPVVSLSSDNDSSLAASSSPALLKPGAGPSTRATMPVKATVNAIQASVDASFAPAATDSDASPERHAPVDLSIDSVRSLAPSQSQPSLAAGESRAKAHQRTRSQLPQSSTIAVHVMSFSPFGASADPDPHTTESTTAVQSEEQQDAVQHAYVPKAKKAPRYQTYDRAFKATGIGQVNPNSTVEQPMTHRKLKSTHEINNIIPSKSVESLHIRSSFVGAVHPIAEPKPPSPFQDQPDSRPASPLMLDIPGPQSSHSRKASVLTDATADNSVDIAAARGSISLVPPEGHRLKGRSKSSYTSQLLLSAQLEIEAQSAKQAQFYAQLPTAPANASTAYTHVYPTVGFDSVTGSPNAAAASADPSIRLQGNVKSSRPAEMQMPLHIAPVGIKPAGAIHSNIRRSVDATAMPDTIDHNALGTALHISHLTQGSTGAQSTAPAATEVQSGANQSALSSIGPSEYKPIIIASSLQKLVATAPLLAQSRRSILIPSVQSSAATKSLVNAVPAHIVSPQPFDAYIPLRASISPHHSTKPHRSKSHPRLLHAAGAQVMAESNTKRGVVHHATRQRRAVDDILHDALMSFLRADQQSMSIQGKRVIDTNTDLHHAHAHTHRAERPMFSIHVDGIAGSGAATSRSSLPSSSLPTLSSFLSPMPRSRRASVAQPAVPAAAAQPQAKADVMPSPPPFHLVSLSDRALFNRANKLQGQFSSPNLHAPAVSHSARSPLGITSLYGAMINTHEHHHTPATERLSFHPLATRIQPNKPSASAAASLPASMSWTSGSHSSVLSDSPVPELPNEPPNAATVTTDNAPPRAAALALSSSAKSLVTPKLVAMSLDLPADPDAMVRSIMKKNSSAMYLNRNVVVVDKKMK